MQPIRDIFAAKQAARKPVISFEFFPTKTDEGERNLMEKTIPALAKLRPDFCSVTYGAGGSTREKTLGLVARIQNEHGLTTMAHLTCVNATEAETRHVLAQARALGVKNILALRGDPPGGTGEFVKTEGGFEFSYQLVQLLREVGGFSIGVAGFPEGHIACREGKLVDWQRLKHKIDCGADFVVTQLFFDNADFYEFRDFLVKAGVKVPIVPGIISIGSAAQIKKFTALCGAKLPAPLLADLEKYAADDVACAAFGVDYATKQAQDLLKNGAPGLHFYTLNKAAATTQIVQRLGLA
ncbi:MAG: methylenetetrahydrofolate reductase [NAD(P)H] [Verrucomicrobia bacterium]|nr:methylenetetrahydrofolate reductase [NAD(P)H] [Verrucomicrobiota bacterium]